MTEADRIIACLGLQPHPEGGWYRETWRGPRIADLMPPPPATGRTVAADAQRPEDGGALGGTAAPEGTGATGGAAGKMDPCGGPFALKRSCPPEGMAAAGVGPTAGAGALGFAEAARPAVRVEACVGTGTSGADPDGTGTAAAGGRASGTAILFLLKAGERSHWHRVDADEIWLWHAGAPLILSMGEATAQDLRLGPDVLGGEVPQAVVSRHWWQAARSTGDWTLVSCTVSPGFRFEGFELAPPGWTLPRV